MGARRQVALGLLVWGLALGAAPSTFARPVGGGDVPDPVDPPVRPTRPPITDPTEPTTPPPATVPGSGAIGAYDPNAIGAAISDPPRRVCRPFMPKPVRAPSGWAVPADYDGDGKFDVAVVRNKGDWAIDFAANGFGAWDLTIGWKDGAPASFVPLPGDYDGDCRADRAAKDSNGNWRIDYAANGFGDWDRTFPGFGGPDYAPVPADYDGDGAVDLSTKDTSGHWYIDFAANGFGTWDAIYSGFGGSDYVPVPADYDGDGKADFSTKSQAGYWFVDWSSNGRGETNWDAIYGGFGGPEFAPVPADYDGDGKADFSTRDTWNNWYIDRSSNGRGETNWDEIHPGFGASATYMPVPGDYDGDGRIDLASRTEDGLWLLDFAADGFGTWNQSWNSFTSVSAGGDLTAQDLYEFDSKWMTPAKQAEGEAQACGWAYSRFGAGSWATVERMNAMVRMYELTRDVKYVQHLDRMVDCLITYRDDHHPGPQHGEIPGTWQYERVIAKPYDVLRRASGLPAWGSPGGDTAWRHVANVTVSSLYAHAIAAFARLVAESPELHGQFGDKAVRAANAALETDLFFLGEMRTRVATPFIEAYLVHHPDLGKPWAWTKADCDSAVDEELNRWPEHDRTADARDWLQRQASNCKNAIDFAGLPIANNENGTFMMALIETTRALDSALYRQSAEASPSAALARSTFPLVVSRSQRFFVNHLQMLSSWFGQMYYWHHEDGIPSDKQHWEDTDHGAQDMRYLRVLSRDLARLNVVAQAWYEPIPMGFVHQLRFANTFLYAIASGSNFADDVVGSAADPVDARNSACEGWLDLTAAKPAVYDRCYEVSLRVVDGDQPYLALGAHVGLLANKRARYPLTYGMPVTTASGAYAP